MFSEVSSKQWKQKIQADLKGADYNQTLIWKTNEGIDVKPFYHKDEITEEFKIEPQQWNVGQIIFVQNEKAANDKAINAIERGAECIKFVIPSDEISIANTIKDIDLNNIYLQFDLQFFKRDFVQKLLAIVVEARTSIHIDPIGHLSKYGNYPDITDPQLPIHNSISIDTNTYQNAGATIVQQIAYGIAHLNEYFNDLESSPQTINTIHFNVAIGTNYFFEIAKLRALRILFKALALEYNYELELKINAIPTKRNKTLYDYNTNMLRTTTECMSAILGGANTIFNLPYDAIYHKDNEFGERIARNQLLILKNESYFDKVTNPSDGAYYIESLTVQLSEKALELFKNIEANGGFLKQLKEGIIQRKIKESATKEQQQFNAGKVSLIGTNKHPNPNDKMKHELELYPFIKTNPVKTLIEPIIEKRLAETIEKDRLKSE